MRQLILFIFIVLATTASAIKSPHGAGFKMECGVCHSTADWSKIKTGEFNHNKTHFPLVGQHKTVSCKKCHTTLEFSKAKTNCSACHTDVHQGTVGNDCERCHNSNSWIVTKVKQLHRQVGFALVGSHATADCNSCHKSASMLRFDHMSTDCYSCHKAKYNATTSPNHKTAGFDTDCARCHTMSGRDWSATGRGFDHGFFPLTGGHNLACDACHENNNYSKKISRECSQCHTAANNNPIPAHRTKYLKYSCGDCHSTQGWAAGVRFKLHDSWFGIYSGKHKGKWSKCTDCHNNDATYKANCRNCHDFDR